MTLPAFAAERRLHAYHLSIDICCRHRRYAAKPPIARRLPLLSIHGTDRRADKHLTFAGSVSNL